jgi:glycosyltransferase involved in cell wall biosynthesis
MSQVLPKLRVCYFGTFSRGEDYPRNNAIIRGLEDNGVEVLICHTQLWSTHDDKMAGAGKGLVSQLWAFIRAHLKLFIKYLKTPDHDLVFVGYIGHIDMFPARLLAWLRGKPVVFDAFYSLYETVVEDRRLYPPGSLQARILRFIDRWSCRLADLVLLDTREHVEYFCCEFKLDKSMFLSIPPGVDEKIFYPRPDPADDGVLDVISYSSYIPLHGIETQLEAAAALKDEKDIRFTFVGTGQEYPAMRARAQELKLTDVRFIGEWLPLVELARIIAQADLCLGIFGTTGKAARVIPYKVYMALAMKKTVIAGDSDAARELLEDGVHALLCPMGDPEALADAIIRLRDDPGLRKSVAEQGYELFVEKCTGRKMAGAVLDRINKRPG